ncbi:unnamed protein product, partial [Tuber aestivum]
LTVRPGAYINNKTAKSCPSRQTPIVHSLRTSDFTAFRHPLRHSRFPSGGCFAPRPLRIPAVEVHSRPAELRSKINRALRGSSNNQTVVRACRAAPCDSQQPPHDIKPSCASAVCK